MSTGSRRQFAPFSECFRIDRSCDRQQVQAVLDEIDGIHRTPLLPKIGIATVVGGAPGEFDPNALTLKLAAGDEYQRLTLVHEIGHILDLFAFDPDLPDYASRSDLSAFATWDNSVRLSQTYRRLRKRLEREQSPEVTAYLRYLVGPAELWARSYAQFIAKRSGRFSPGIALDLKGIIGQQKRRGTLPEQWPWEDFDAIDTAIERLLEAMSWLR